LRPVLQVVKLIADAQRTNGWGTWQPNLPEFKAGFKRLCEYQMQKLQIRTAKEAQLLMYTEESFARFGAEREIGKKLTRTKEAQKRKVDATVEGWLEWSHALANADSPTPPPASNANTDILRDAYKGKYPWAADADAGTHSALQM
jgi:hypothetical protein